MSVPITVPVAEPDRVPSDPSAALREVAAWLDRARADGHKAMAFRRAAQTLDTLDEAERADRYAHARLTGMTGIGPSSQAIIAQTLAGRVPDYLASLRSAAVRLTSGGDTIRPLLLGDLHVHTDQSDGSAPLEEMVDAAAALGHRYIAITDHSPRLTVANGLSAERLAEQGSLIDRVNAAHSDIRVLKGIEVDILDSGGLDQTPAALAALDVVVASVHSKLQMDRESMTHRMVGAIANPRVTVLGHCTGRLVEGGRGRRAESTFDAEVVFEACREFRVAVEINSRPERRDPPTRLLELARDMGCLFSIDTDSHAPGQLDFCWYGAERAEAAGIEPSRILTTWPADELVDWARGKMG